ncbi:Protein priA [Vanrija pseudolonga]|uniref:Protein priA n=1 Tax=Vanrija pseudolonga TaxID=143232 RepID=A0AAF0Y0U4_9TREE|nr:Protein priA [Vanrija pseudolonga]
MTILFAIATILLLKLVNAYEIEYVWPGPENKLTRPPSPNAWPYACFWPCWQQSAAQVGCDPYDKVCTCNGTPTWTDSAFWQAQSACLSAAPFPCPLSTGRTAYSGVCTPGNYLIRPASSSSDSPTLTSGPTDSPTNTAAPTTTTSVDAVPTAARRRMGLDLLARACEPGFTACKANRGTVKNPFQLPMAGDAYVAYSCIDTQSDLESCGGCPGEDGVDCSAIRGAVSAACVRGRCVVKKCERRFRLRHGECL